MNAPAHDPLAPPHLAMLRDESGIADDVIAERGYRSIDAKDGYPLLKRLGFSKIQAKNWPGLYMPRHTPTGTIAVGQYRPDTPRLSADGKPIKYETPRGGWVGLDVPPRCLPDLMRPEIPLYITEGIKKGDAIATHGGCAVALAGVWAFRSSKRILDEWDVIPMLGRPVIVVYDSDVMTKDKVQKALQALTRFLTNKGARVGWCHLQPDAEKEKVGVDDFLARSGTLRNLETLTSAAKQDARKRQNGAQTQPDLRPTIQISTDITGMVDAGERAILTMDSTPRLYQRARRLCRIARGVRAPRFLNRPADAPVILEANAAFLLELATQAAHWEKFDRRQGVWRPALPPTREFVDVLRAREEWPFPVLEGIVYTPTLRPDGSILSTPGYDPDTGLFFDSNGIQFPSLPTKPGLDEARTAIGALQEALMDFPFQDGFKVHFSAALASILSVVCRFAIQGNVPLFAVRSTTRGSGKGLLVDVVSVIGTGRHAPRWSQTTDDEEERKRLLTLALDGDPIILIDNVTQPLGSAPLDAALTASIFKDRLLGRNESKEAPMHAVFFASGNNMAFKGDTARRVVPIDLDPKMERPEERTGFHHPRLLQWVAKERPRLVCQAITLLASYFQAGQPKQQITAMGSFEEWSDLIRGALVWAGEADPCEGRKDIEAESDPDFENYRSLLTCWHDCYGEKAVTLSQVTKDISTNAAKTYDTDFIPNRWNALRDALFAFDERFDGKGLDTRKIGNALRPYQGRVVDKMRLKKGGTYNRATLWRIEIL